MPSFSVDTALGVLVGTSFGWLLGRFTLAIIYRIRARKGK